MISSPSVADSMDTIIFDQLELYATRAAEAQEAGDTELKDFWVQQGYDLINESSLLTLDM